MLTSDMFYHPVLGHSLPTLAELMARANEEAHYLLGVAGRLAALRQQHDARLQAALTAGEDLVGPKRLLYATSSRVTQGDLLRAFFTQPVLLADTYQGEQVPELFDATTRESLALLAEAPPEVPDLTVAFSWGAPYVLQKRLGIDAALTPQTLLASLDDRGRFHLGSYLRLYQDGLIAPGDAIHWIKAHTLQPSVVPLVPDVFVDASNNFASLHAALDNAPGCWLVGEQADETFCAWSTRQKYEDPTGFRGGPWFHGNEPDDALEVYSGRWFAILVGNTTVDERRYGQFLRNIDPTELAALLSFVTQTPEHHRLVLMGTLEDHARVCAAVPAMRTLPTIATPAWTEPERLLRWCASVSRAALPGGQVPSVHQMIQGFFRSADRFPDSRWEMDQALQGDLDQSKTPLLGAMRRLKSEKPLRTYQQEAVRTWVGTEEHLRALIQFSEQWAQYEG